MDFDYSVFLILEGDCFRDIDGCGFSGVTGNRYGSGISLGSDGIFETVNFKFIAYRCMRGNACD